MDSDLDLLRAWAAGDEDAGETLVQRYLPTLYRFFRNKVPSATEDLAQRTWLGCLERAETLDPEKGFRAYLLGVARYQLLMHLRREIRDREMFDPQTVSIADAAGSPSSVVRAKREQELLLAALRHLPVDLQITVELFYWERASHAEIADICGVPLGTVKSRLNRARETLRTIMENADADPAVVHSAVGGFEEWARGLRSDTESE